jgi:hypothetical protein
MGREIEWGMRRRNGISRGKPRKKVSKRMKCTQVDFDSNRNIAVQVKGYESLKDNGVPASPTA